MQGLNLIQGKNISIHALREEGDLFCAQEVSCFVISIHALREEGDSPAPECRRPLLPFLSTPSARRATSYNQAGHVDVVISIHALREEGDWSFASRQQMNGKFLSTPSARRAAELQVEHEFGSG